MSKSIVTEYTDYCMICGKPREEMHHMLYGSGKHKLADKDKLLMPLCGDHHNSSNMSIHHNKEMKALSQMLAQAIWERNWIANHCNSDYHTAESDLKDAREAFMKRYGENYL